MLANQEVKTQSNHEGMKKYITHAYFEVPFYIVMSKADHFWFLHQPLH